MEVKIVRLNENAVIPERGSNEAAGYDLRVCITEEVSIKPHETFLAPIGIAMEIPSGYFGGVFARSGLSTKEGLRPANCVGVIDSDYRGEVKVPVHNDSEVVRTLTPNEKVAQMVILPYLAVSFTEVSDLSDTERGVGGFGSTGK